MTPSMGAALFVVVAASAFGVEAPDERIGHPEHRDESLSRRVAESAGTFRLDVEQCEIFLLGGLPFRGGISASGWPGRTVSSGALT